MDIENTDTLVAYLRSTGRIGAAERPRCTRLKGGVSNRTVRVERDSGEAWVLKQALTKLRVPGDWYSDPDRVHREALGIRWLADLLPHGTVPAFVFEDHEHHVLAMQAVPEPHTNWKELLLAGRLDPDHVDRFGRLLGAIHREGSRRRATLADVFDDRRVFESLRLDPYFRVTASRVPAASPFLGRIVEEVAGRRLTLVHGDYSPKNVLVHDERLVLLDHEVIHFGDPAFDLGFAMTHLLSKAHFVEQRRAEFAAATQAFWEAYAAELGETAWSADLEPVAVRHTLACLAARVAGRSTLEYLDAAARQRQIEAVCALMPHPPERIADLIDAFIRRL